MIGVEFDTPLEFLRLAEAGRTLAAGGKVRALVVDDEASIRNLLSRFLVRRGFAVDTAADGAEALAKIAEEPPDILVMDLYMPKVNGHEVLKRIKDNDMGVGVICTISGYAFLTLKPLLLVLNVGEDAAAEPPPDGVRKAAEERGFHSLYVPEHTHIPTSRRTPPPTGTRSTTGMRSPQRQWVLARLLTIWLKPQVMKSPNCISTMGT